MNAPQTPALSVDARRYWQSVERSAEIGLGRPGGLARVALCDADKEKRDEFVAWCKAAGCTAIPRAEVDYLLARLAEKDSRAVL